MSRVGGYDRIATCELVKQAVWTLELLRSCADCCECDDVGGHLDTTRRAAGAHCSWSTATPSYGKKIMHARSHLDLPYGPFNHATCKRRVRTALYRPASHVAQAHACPSAGVAPCGVCARDATSCWLWRGTGVPTTTDGVPDSTGCPIGTLPVVRLPRLLPPPAPAVAPPGVTGKPIGTASAGRFTPAGCA